MMTSEILSAYKKLARQEHALQIMEDGDQSSCNRVAIARRDEALASLAGVLDRHIEERVRELINVLVPEIIAAHEEAQRDYQRLGY